MLTDAHGNPLDFRITAGQISDYEMAEELIQGRTAEYVIADKGYDGDKIRAIIEEINAKPVIPYRSSRKNPGILDAVLYGARHAIENFFNKIKNYRSVSCRYDKTTLSYSAMLTIACILTWIKL
jgi:transposase